MFLMNSYELFKEKINSLLQPAIPHWRSMEKIQIGRTSIVICERTKLIEG
jgi:hypothetical protein